ncbi:hypothetical protein [Azospirillum sp. A39]|uniref:hypothetical protein n=1 Tax=Azospirillum sp. A39 TaxID=3462279 RepID=UPI0040455414
MNLALAFAFAFLAACAIFAGGVTLLLRPGARLNDTIAGLVPVVIGAAGLAATAGPSFAADGFHTVAVPPELVSMAVDYVLLALGLLAGWLLRRIAAWLDLDREGKLVQRLETGMQAALGYARERLLAAGKDLDDVAVRSELVALAAGYLAPKLPDTLRALKIDPDGLQDRLTARLDGVVPHSSSPLSVARIVGD